MLGHRELTMEDYVAILKRRYRLILISAFVCVVLGVGVTRIIPPKYESQTLILVDQPKVPVDYVKPVVATDLNDQLSSMKEQILSRSRLEPIIKKFNLYPGAALKMDDRVALTQKAIGIKPIPSSKSNVPGFFITFTGSDPHQAQDVCTQITSLFVNENLNARTESAQNTTTFIKQQLDESKRNLDEQDAKLAAFEQKYFGRLPDQAQTNSNTLQALTTQLDAATQSLIRQQQSVTFLQSMVSQQTQSLQNAEPAAAAAIVDERKTQLKALQQQKQALQTQYTPDHPDVVEITRKISDLQAQIAAAPAEASAASATRPITRPDTPQLQELKAQLRSAEQAMQDAKAEQVRIETAVRTYESRIESTPQVEAEYKQLTRDHQTALDFYNSLLKKLNDSSMATELEQRQQGEQFRVMDPPNLPESRKFPKRSIFAAGGFGMGLIFGLLLAAWFEYRDTSLRSERDVWAFTKLSTLAVISHIDGLSEPEVKSSRLKLFNNKPTEISLG